MKPAALEALLEDIRGCRLCEDSLEHGVRPVLQVASSARILVAGQAPGLRVHRSGVPFDDPSGVRLREWMGVTPAEFYDPSRIAIVPMGFCYPGTGRSGDLAPRPECAAAWRSALLDQLGELRLTLVVGLHAARWHLGARREGLTETVRRWKEHAPSCIPLPHPSPRNNAWLRRHPWFERDVLPELRLRVRRALGRAVSPPATPDSR